MQDFIGNIVHSIAGKRRAEKGEKTSKASFIYSSWHSRRQLAGYWRGIATRCRQAKCTSSSAHTPPMTKRQSHANKQKQHWKSIHCNDGKDA